MYTYTVKLVYWQLLLYGVHVGHSFKNSTIFSGWLVYTYRQNILIINLFKTMLLLKNGYVGLNAACQFAGPIWFINLHRAVELFVNYAAKQCGEFCYSTYWIHGMISNWIVLANTFRKLNRMITGAHKGQFSKLEMDSSPWIFTRLSWPRVSFVSSVSTSPYPTKESLYACVPCLGIVDTDISGHIANIPIPGNDDSLDCIVFYNTHISQYILEKKYGNVSGWFFHVRNGKRLVNFVDWVYAFYINKSGSIEANKILKKQKEKKNIVKILKQKLSFTVKTGDHFSWGIDFFFGKNYGLTSFKEQVDLFEPDEQQFNLEKVFLMHRKTSIFLSKAINYFIIKTSWRFKKYIKRKSFSDKLFKLRFMVGFYHPVGDWESSTNYLDQRFLPNKIYKTHLRRNNLRPNKFILKFVKFYYLQKFNKLRGFWSRYAINLLKVSSLAYVSLSYGSKLFDNNIYKPLLQYGKTFNSLFSKKKVDILYKWSFFKKNVKIYLTKILRNKNINKYIKFYYYYKTFNVLKKLIIKKTKLLYNYYNFFFSFWFWNKATYDIKKSDKYTFLYIVWKILKNLERNYIYLKFLNKAKNNYSSFRYFFFKDKLKYKKLFNLNNYSFISFFKVMSKMFRHTYLLKTTNFIFNRLIRIKSYFKKNIRGNKIIRRKNWKCLKWNKQHKFDHLTSYEKASLLFESYDSSKYLQPFSINPKKLTYYKRFISNSNVNNNFLWIKKNKYKIIFMYSKLKKLLAKVGNLKIKRLYLFSKILNKYKNFFLNLKKNLFNKQFFFRFIKNNKHFIWLTKFINLYSLCFPKLNFFKHLLKYKYFNTDLNFNQGSKNFYFFEYLPILNNIEFFSNISIKQEKILNKLFFKYNHKSFFKLNYNIEYYNLNYFFRFKYLKRLTIKKIKRLYFLIKYIKLHGYKLWFNLKFLNLYKNQLKKNYILEKIHDKYKIRIKGVRYFIKLGKNLLNLSVADEYWKYTKLAFKYPDYFYFTLKKYNNNYELLNIKIFDYKLNIKNTYYTYLFTLRFFYLYQYYFKPISNFKYLQLKYWGKTYTKQYKIYYWI